MVYKFKGKYCNIKTSKKRANLVTTLESRFKVLFDHAYYKFNTDFYKYSSSWCSAIHVPYVHVIMNGILVIIFYLIMLARYNKKTCMSNLWKFFFQIYSIAWYWKLPSNQHFFTQNNFSFLTCYMYLQQNKLHLAICRQSGLSEMIKVVHQCYTN